MQEISFRLWMKWKASMQGVTSIEYAILIGLMAVGIAAGSGKLSEVINAMFDSLATQTETTLNGPTDQSGS
ncbi:Flp family type IVb pilin [Temperatibacter marinus]|uniref:Flp family type IVb pilin n=1 Tax=Temperatibacter marinus TaxID=1456591 RepID=A0AA52EIT4_9PROT|nr:Flp family type IVb pilin [Temperatibacter marinus]WND03312.1 Flp family type IVb pilin [Temperatibacter marinus]